jgi:hypothetical protein
VFVACNTARIHTPDWIWRTRSKTARRIRSRKDKF